MPGHAGQRLGASSQISGGGPCGRVRGPVLVLARSRSSAPPRRRSPGGAVLRRTHDRPVRVEHPLVLTDRGAHHLDEVARGQLLGAGGDQPVDLAACRWLNSGSLNGSRVRPTASPAMASRMLSKRCADRDAHRAAARAGCLVDGRPHRPGEHLPGAVTARPVEEEVADVLQGDHVVGDDPGVDLRGLVLAAQEQPVHLDAENPARLRRLEDQPHAQGIGRPPDDHAQHRSSHHWPNQWSTMATGMPRAKPKTNPKATIRLARAGRSHGRSAPPGRGSSGNG